MSDLRDVSHMSHRILKLPKFGHEPLLSALMAVEVWSEERSRVHLGAALVTFRSTQSLIFDHNRL